MNLTCSLRVGIAVGLLLISLCISCLGEVQENSRQAHINLLPDSLSETPNNSLPETLAEIPPETPSKTLNEIQPESLPYCKLMEDLRDLYSGEILLINQSPQIQLSDTVLSADRQSIGQHIHTLSEYESQLRYRAVRLAQFESRLTEEWPELSLEERVSLTERLEELLRVQASRLYYFQSQLKKKYCLFPIREKNKFVNSFEDLLDREADLLQGFEDFLHQLQDAPQDDQIELLASFEDLIRRQAILLDTYEDFLKVNCNVLRIYKYVNRCGVYRAGQNITYTYVIKNTCNCSIDSIAIVDSRLGPIVGDISLGPHEKKSFNKSTVLNYPPGTMVCNTARAWGIDPNNFTIMRESNEVCIRMASPATNRDSLELGNQKALAIASDPAAAENSILIKKNQKSKCCENKDSANLMAIHVGDQLAAAHRSSKASNNIKIVSSQQ